MLETGIYFAGDAEKLQERSFVIPVRKVTPDEIQQYNYDSDSLIPDDPATWRKPTTEELIPLMATADTPLGLTVEVVRFDPKVVRQADRLFAQPDFHPDTNEPPIELVPGVWGQLSDILINDPDIPTSVHRDPRRINRDGGQSFSRPGLHIDNIEQLPIRDRLTSKRRAIINGGGDNRFSVVIFTTNALTIGKDIAPGDESFVTTTNEARQYVEKHPEQRALLIEYGPGEGIILPYQTAIHDGSTRTKRRSKLVCINEDPGRRWQRSSFRRASVLHG